MLGDLEQRAVDGEFGQVYVNGVWQADIRDFSGQLAIEQRPISVAGTKRLIYRRGRITRSGGFNFLKVDSRVEQLFIDYSNLTPDEQRRMRGQGIDPMPDATLIVKLDDPDSWGCEEVMLGGVKMWGVPLGYPQSGNIERNVTCTWDRNRMLKGIPRPGNTGGWTPPPGEVTWPNAGETPVI